MTFNQIHYFLTVAEIQSFTQAASVLFVAQSTLSRSIADLESELGVSLLVRQFHSLRLTAAGELFYREMKAAMESIRGIVRRVQEAGSNADRRLSIGVLDGQSVDPQILLALRQLSDSFPQFSMELRRLSHAELIRALKLRELDIAETVLPADASVDNDIGCLLIGQVRLCLIGGRDDPIWSGDTAIASLNDRVLVTPKTQDPTQEYAFRFLDKSGIMPRVKFAGDMDTHALWLEAGIGLSICSESHVIYASKAFRPLRAQPLKELPPASVALLWNKRSCPPMAERLLSFFGQTATDTRR